jgi:hypothetical protein
MGNWDNRASRSSLALFAICSLCLPAYAKYGGGSGTEADPYRIYTAEQMNTIGANPADWDKHFKLMADIDLSAYTGTAFNIIGRGTPFDPVSNPFSGVFDGSGHTISNFTYTSTGVNAIAVFGNVSGVSSEIMDLKLLTPNVRAGVGDYVGALVGAFESGVISSCRVEGGNISGRLYVGGVVGSDEGTIINCCSSGSVWGDWYVGGLVGGVGDGKVTMCYSTAAVSGNTDVGGLAGWTADETSAVTNCYATGGVRGDIYVGGLVGQVERGAAYKCFSTGKVSGNQYVGGLVGNVRVLGTVMHCFWDTQTSGWPTSADETGGIGKTTAQMRTISTFTAAAWDFFTIWTICEAVNYPVLLWQIPAGDFRCPDGVDWIDLAWFAQHWLNEQCFAANSYCDGVDLDHSSFVDFADFAVFAGNWLTGIR